jgi:hypothetical protein
MLPRCPFPKHCRSSGQNLPLVGLPDDLTMLIPRHVVRAYRDELSSKNQGGQGLSRVSPERERARFPIKRQPTLYWLALALVGAVALALVITHMMLTRADISSSVSEKNQTALLAVERPAFRCEWLPPVLRVEVPSTARPARGAYSTSVDFNNTPAEAARFASDQHRLMFLLHVSGNFEEPGFT